MTMTYLQTHNRSWYHGRIALIAIISLFIIIAAVQLLFPYFFAGIFIGMAKPFWRLKFSVESGLFSSTESLIWENEMLKRQLAEIQTGSTTVNAVMFENQELRAILGRASTTPLVLAAVLVRPPLSAYDVFIIDIGKDHGLISGGPVYAPGNVIIGHIGTVLSQTAKVQLLSSPDKKYDVLIGSSSVSAIAIGEGGGYFEARVSREDFVSKGDFVLAPSLGNRVIGIVTDITTDSNQPFQSVFFAPPINIYEIRWLLVGKFVM